MKTSTLAERILQNTSGNLFSEVLKWLTQETMGKGRLI